MSSAAADRFHDLVELVRTLRSPEGCPWDRAQTFESLRSFVLEETYEVLEAIDRRDLASLREELGDFIFEAVLLAQLASETGAFTVADSLAAITDKLIRRHPHVFGTKTGTTADTGPKSAEEVVQRWEALKARERSSAGARTSAMGDVPRALPALLRAHTIGQRAAAVNFDWDTAADVLDKVREELDELQHQIARGGPPDRVEDELGDVLFSIAHLARKLGVEPESALRRANEKFLSRFAEMERRITSSGRTLREMTLAELEDEWQRVKRDQHEDRRHKDTKREGR
ncbi:MAG: nucleoside triphosphate pyrophosphohydrolase [Acidobacteria bacterium]|nr:nucleoside triphosphate pyrophosphohydrolase [Acidobacteriota bacterium]